MPQKSRTYYEKTVCLPTDPPFLGSLLYHVNYRNKSVNTVLFSSLRVNVSEPLCSRMI